MGPWQKKNQKKGNTSAKKNRGSREAGTMVSTPFEETLSAAVASTSSTGAAEASNEANGANETSDPSAGKYDAEPAATEPVKEAAAVDPEDEDSPINEETVAEMKAFIRNALASQRDYVAEDFSEAVEGFVHSPYGLVLRYPHDVFLAALDNVINHDIENNNPSDHRVANIKIIMNRFYKVMMIWIADCLAE